MRSALCDDQRTTETGRAGGQSGERVTAERERQREGESGDNTCDVRGQYGGIMWAASHQVGLSRVSEKIRRSLGSLKYLETFKRMNPVITPLKNPAQRAGGFSASGPSGRIFEGV